MAGVPDSQAQKDMGARLQAVREAVGLTQEDLCETMGIVVTTLSGWETGRNQIDIVKLARAATRWGFTTDWVARGDLSGLRRTLADKVEAAMAKEHPPQRGRPRKTASQPKGPAPALGAARRAKAPHSPLPSQIIDRPDELAWVSFWRGLNDAERAEALKKLRVSTREPVGT